MSFILVAPLLTSLSLPDSESEPDFSDPDSSSSESEDSSCFAFRKKSV